MTDKKTAPMKTIQAESIFEVLKYVYSLSSLNSTFRFRGQSNFNWSLQPSIYRYENLKRYQVLFFEEALLAQKPSKPIPHLINTGLDFEFLMLCQHYEIPTRLLDWTTDVLTALFFSCIDCSEKNSDGALFICNQNDYPSIPAIEYNPVNVQELSFINTCVINPRMRTQSGCFMIWGHSPLKKEDSSESYDLDQFHNHDCNKNQFLQKIRIPKLYKSSILNELEKIYGISNHSIYISKGYLENNFRNVFLDIKARSRLQTFYLTDADRLTKDELLLAEKLSPRIGKNAFKDCYNLTSFNGIFR